MYLADKLALVSAVYLAGREDCDHETPQACCLAVV